MDCYGMDLLFWPFRYTHFQCTSPGICYQHGKQEEPRKWNELILLFHFVTNITYFIFNVNMSIKYKFNKKLILNTFNFH